MDLMFLLVLVLVLVFVFVATRAPVKTVAARA